MRITEDIYSDGLTYEGTWCKNQAVWKEKLICLAHLDSGRVFTCECKKDGKHCIDCEVKSWK